MASAQLDEISELEIELDKLLSEQDLDELRTENQKLTYQINTLKKAIAVEKANIVPAKGNFEVI